MEEGRRELAQVKEELARVKEEVARVRKEVVAAKEEVSRAEEGKAGAEARAKAMVGMRDQEVEARKTSERFALQMQLLAARLGPRA